MSSVELEDGKHEIIIVKRGHDEHDDHHGGVWKIAFADFMTAMMCFFLVMWLINAANEQTKAAVASYFNPVKLIDRNSSRKGLEDIGDGPNSSGMSAELMKEANGKVEAESSGNGQSKENSTEESSAPSETKDEHLFSDPYAVLAEIATNTNERQNISDKGDGGAQLSGPATGASGGESYRDPFAPDFWSQQVAVPDAAEASAERSQAEETVKEELTPQDQAMIDELAGKKPEPVAQPEQLPAAAVEEHAEAGAGAKPADKPEPRPETTTAELKPDASESEPKPEIEKAESKPDVGPSPEAIKTAREIKQELAKAFGTGDKAYDGIGVVATDRGVVISVTEQLDFGMFEIGSAVPRRELVLAMEKIGRIVSEKNGTVSVNGHTDGRPFRNGAYDNWRLSTARAHSAYYMLVRGGMPEDRITEVAGFADRKLKVPAEPYAAANRRIEILLETPR